MKNGKYDVLWTAVALLVGSLLIGVSTAQAEVKLPALFSDNMILQRDMPLPIWGWADSGEQITVEFAGQKKTATADDKGRWKVVLDPLAASAEPRTMIISGSIQNPKSKIQNVLVGEVWVASGQSNMAMSVSRAANAEQVIAEANYPQIRFFNESSSGAASPQENCAGQWRECSPETLGGFSATAYFFALNLRKALNAPIGVVQSAVGGTPAEAWTSRKSLESDAELKPIIEQWQEVLDDFPKAEAEYQKKLEQWREKAKDLRKAGKDTGRAPRPKYKGAATMLFNGKIAPLIPYAIRGAIWYQGENNANRNLSYQYRRLLPALITSWRTAWGQGDFPFLFVQLPNYKAVQPEPSESAWAEIRESFLKTLSLPGTGMAVTIDIGDAKNIHPTNKADVGYRLALWTRAMVYGEKIVYSSPLYESMKVEGNKIRLSFKHVGGGLVAKGGPLKQFAVAGEDKKFVWANAEIEGDTVVVWSDQAPKPVAVRYAWADNPEGCNLYNNEGLPASPFRTDDWPGVTYGKVIGERAAP